MLKPTEDTLVRSPTVQTSIAEKKVTNFKPSSASGNTSGTQYNAVLSGASLRDEIIEVLRTGVVAAGGSSRRHWLNYYLSHPECKKKQRADLFHKPHDNDLDMTEFCQIACENYRLLNNDIAKIALATLCDDGLTKLLSDYTLTEDNWQTILWLEVDEKFECAGDHYRKISEQRKAIFTWTGPLESFINKFKLKGTDNFKTLGRALMSYIMEASSSTTSNIEPLYLPITYIDFFNVQSPEEYDRLVKLCVNTNPKLLTPMPQTPAALENFRRYLATLPTFSHRAVTQSEHFKQMRPDLQLDLWLDMDPASPYFTMQNLLNLLPEPRIFAAAQRKNMPLLDSSKLTELLYKYSEILTSSYEETICLAANAKIVNLMQTHEMEVQKIIAYSKKKEQYQAIPLDIAGKRKAVNEDNTNTLAKWYTLFEIYKGWCTDKGIGHRKTDLMSRTNIVSFLQHHEARGGSSSQQKIRLEEFAVQIKNLLRENQDNDGNSRAGLSSDDLRDTARSFIRSFALSEFCSSAELGQLKIVLSDLDLTMASNPVRALVEKLSTSDYASTTFNRLDLQDMQVLAELIQIDYRPFNLSKQSAKLLFIPDVDDKSSRELAASFFLSALELNETNDKVTPIDDFMQAMEHISMNHDAKHLKRLEGVYLSYYARIILSQGLVADETRKIPDFENMLRAEQHRLKHDWVHLQFGGEINYNPTVRCIAFLGNYFQNRASDKIKVAPLVLQLKEVLKFGDPLGVVAAYFEYQCSTKTEADFKKFLKKIPSKLKSDITHETKSEIWKSLVELRSELLQKAQDLTNSPEQKAVLLTNCLKLEQSIQHIFPDHDNTFYELFDVIKLSGDNKLIDKFRLMLDLDDPMCLLSHFAAYNCDTTAPRALDKLLSAINRPFDLSDSEMKKEALTLFQKLIADSVSALYSDSSMTFQEKIKLLEECCRIEKIRKTVFTYEPAYQFDEAVFKAAKSLVMDDSIEKTLAIITSLRNLFQQIQTLMPITDPNCCEAIAIKYTYLSTYFSQKEQLIKEMGVSIGSAMCRNNDFVKRYTMMRLIMMFKLYPHDLQKLSQAFTYTEPGFNLSIFKTRLSDRLTGIILQDLLNLINRENGDFSATIAMQSLSQAEINVLNALFNIDNIRERVRLQFLGNSQGTTWQMARSDLGWNIRDSQTLFQLKSHFQDLKNSYHVRGGRLYDCVSAILQDCKSYIEQLQEYLITAPASTSTAASALPRLEFSQPATPVAEGFLPRSRYENPYYAGQGVYYPSPGGLDVGQPIAHDVPVSGYGHLYPTVPQMSEASRGSFDPKLDDELPKTVTDEPIVLTTGVATEAVPSPLTEAGRRAVTVPTTSGQAQRPEHTRMWMDALFRRRGDSPRSAPQLNDIQLVRP